MRKLIFLFLALFAGGVCFAQVKVEHLLTENSVDPISVDALIPRFSWKLNADGRRDVKQIVYEIKVTNGKRAFGIRER